jgi:hypothetical protein
VVFKSASNTVTMNRSEFATMSRAVVPVDAYEA